MSKMAERALSRNEQNDDIEVYTRVTMYQSMLEGLGDAAFKATFGCLDYDGFNKYVDKAILMNSYKELGK